MKAYIQYFSSAKGEYLFRGHCLGQELLIVVEELKKYCEQEKWYYLLKKELEDKKYELRQQDILDKILRENVSIDFNFAYKLHLFDCLEPECLIGEGELGNAIIELCSRANLIFIVNKRNYSTKDEIWIHFEVCHEDFQFDCHKALMTHTIKE